MLLRKQNPCSLSNLKDRSMRPQNYNLKPFQSVVRGKTLLGHTSIPVSASSFVKTEDADDYKLENMLQAGIRPDVVTRPYFTPTIDDISFMTERLKDEEIFIPKTEAQSQTTETQSQTTE